VCQDSAGKLANAFVCTANIAAEDGGVAIVEGNRKVLAARLSDARFFWEQDRKTPLAEHAKKLERITFHEKLGTVADKVERVAKLARWLVESDIVVPAKAGTALGKGSTSRAIPAFAGMTKEELADLAEQAARLCKADLVTEMVGEFPELQGVMGGYYARAEGLDPQIADAIRDHYKPVGQGDEIPTAPVTVAVSLADKLDTLVSFFLDDMRPTGSKDPFALRRATLGLISLIVENDIRVPFDELVFRAEEFASMARFERVSKSIDEKYGAALNLLGIRAETETSISRARYDHDIKVAFNEIFLIASGLRDFVADRLKVQQREAGVRHDLIDAVFALGGEDDLVRLLARVKALQHYIETAEGADLLAAYKRAANILKKEGYEGPPGAPNLLLLGSLKDNNDGIPNTGEEDPLAVVDDPDLVAVVAAQLEEKRNKTLSYTPEPAETALIAALDSAEPAAVRAVEAEDFSAAMAALATLRGPIDAFFDSVTVNDPDRDKRAARLDLLARFRDAVHRVADFSRIEG
jgi:glycyl-tRNA synthetase beta chain